jgi:RNA polymerase sigma-70 factor (ECF subfamily)
VQSVDIATIHACQRGYREAFRRIYEACHRKVYALVYRYTNDPEEALDLSQEVFVRVHTHIAGFRGECALETWIYRIATNTIISTLRKSRPHEQLTEEIEAHPDAAPLPEAHLEDLEMEQRVKRAIAELPESLRMAFVLVAVEHPIPFFVVHDGELWCDVFFALGDRHQLAVDVREFIKPPPLSIVKRNGDRGKLHLFHNRRWKVIPEADTSQPQV